VAGLSVIGIFAWPRRHLVPALIAAPAALVVAAVAILDKGLEFSSTAGRLTYWSDLARLLVEYPLTGTGLGVDTAYRASIQYQINPDPERVFYAHNTLVQSYLELGPLGAVGMLLVPLAAITAAIVARGDGYLKQRRSLLVAGLGLVGGLTAHGLTDQVVTTNIGTGVLLLGLAATLGALTPRALAVMGRLARATGLVLVALTAIALLAFAAMPSGRAQVLLDFGSLQLNRALALDSQSSGRAGQLDQAEATLSMALAQDRGHPAVLRELARARSARFDDAHALEALEQAAASPRIDAFDMLQIAQQYRDLGFAETASVWATRAYATWGRPAEGAAMQAYARATLAVMDDFRARTLADQAEAAMRARRFGEAHALFQEALTFRPESAYLQDRLGAARRAVDKYGAG
jgi:Tfp pilus assembly protein PilF